MPLLDHFHPPLSIQRPWQGFHSAWASTIAQQLNQGLLPPRFFAMPTVHVGGQIEIDVATLQEAGASAEGGAAVATAVWAPPRPTVSLPVDFAGLDLFEVQVFHEETGPRLLAAIELVSPANKDRPGHRQAFAVKCASYLQQGVSLVVVDVVTERLASLHAELLRLVAPGGNGPLWQSPSNLYAAAYRVAAEGEQTRLEAWPEALGLGEELPKVPLWLRPDCVLPLDLERSYAATCAWLRISP
jgi:hypothetical protein